MIKAMGEASAHKINNKLNCLISPPTPATPENVKTGIRSTWHDPNHVTHNRHSDPGTLSGSIDTITERCRIQRHGGRSIVIHKEGGLQ